MIITLWRAMWGLLMIQAIRSSYSVCKQFFDLVYYGEQHTMPLLLWCSTFVLFLCYAILIVGVLLITANETNFKELATKTFLSSVLGLHTMLTCLLSVGYVLSGGIDKSPVPVQLELLCWYVTMIPLTYFYLKARKLQ